MEIKISKQELAKKLQHVQSIVDRKTTMPILSNVLLTTQNKKLWLSATDLEVGMSISAEADVLTEGKITIDARSFYDVVRELPDDVIHFSVKENNRIELKCGRSEFKIMGLAADEFPALPKKGEGNTFAFPCAAVVQMMEKAAFAMSTDEARYNLNGVLLEQHKNESATFLRMVATDGHRLSVVDREMKGGWQLPKAVIVPRKGIAELKRLIENQDGSFDLWIDEKHAIAFVGDVTLYVRLIDGQFPPYSQVVPKKSKRVIVVPRKELLSGLRRVSSMANERSKGVRFRFSPKHLEISSSNPDRGEAREELSIDYRGEAFDVGFNARYFLDALSLIEDEQAVLELGEDTAPCVLRSELDKGFTHVIMPMRL